ncbi:MAG: hypothetical protein AAF750_16825 [Planctomycetota bacterium]
MSRRNVSLIVLLVVLGGLALWLNFRPAPGLQASVVRISNGPISFAFSDDLLIQELRVDRLDGLDGAEVERVWHLQRREIEPDENGVVEPIPDRWWISAVAYGRPPPGMRRHPDSETPRRGLDLIAGDTYRLTLVAEPEAVVLEFTP